MSSIGIDNNTIKYRLITENLTTKCLAKLKSNYLSVKQTVAYFKEGVARTLDYRCEGDKRAD